MHNCTFRSWLSYLYHVADHQLVKTTSKQSSLNKITNPKSETAPEQWKFASFGSNTLTGAYGHLAGAQYQTTKTVSNHQSTNSQPQTESGTKDMADRPNQSVSGHQSEKICSKKVSNSEMYKVIQKFLFMFDCKSDKGRFVFLCKYLLQNVDNEISTKVSTRSYNNSNLFAPIHFIVVWTCRTPMLRYLYTNNWWRCGSCS